MKPSIKLTRNPFTGEALYECRGFKPYGDVIRGMYIVVGYGSTPVEAYYDWKINSPKAIDKW